MTRAHATLALLLAGALWLGVDRCYAVRTAESIGALTEAATTAQKLADHAVQQARVSVLRAERLAAEKDSVIRVTDALRSQHRRTTAALSGQVGAALVAARDSTVTADSLRRVIEATAEKWRVDSIANAEKEAGWLAERGTMQGIIARQAEAIGDQKAAALAVNVAHMRKVAELQARIPSARAQFVRTARDILIGAGAACVMFCG